MATMDRKRVTKKKQFNSVRQLINDGLELLTLGRDVREIEPDTTIYIDHSRFGINHSQSQELTEHEFDISKPYETATIIRGHLKPGLRVLFVLGNNSYLDLTAPTESASNRICEETAAKAARFNSPFHKNNTAYFWRRDDDKTKSAIRIFLMSADILEGFQEGVKDANAQILGAITSSDFSLGQKFSNINSIQKSNTKNKQNLLSEFIALRKLPKLYSIFFVTFLIFFMSAITSFSISGQRIAALTGASSQARSSLEMFATEGQIAAKLDKMRKASSIKIWLINAIATKMEDGSWINRIKVNDSAVEISGISKSAADTLRQIAEIENTSRVRLLSSVIRDNETQLERFIIGLDLI